MLVPRFCNDCRGEPEENVPTYRFSREGVVVLELCPRHSVTRLAVFLEAAVPGPPAAAEEG